MACYIPIFQKKKRVLDSNIKKLLHAINANDCNNISINAQKVKLSVISYIKSELSQVKPQGLKIDKIQYLESELKKWENINVKHIIDLVGSGNVKLV